jgi:hypothetical protein
MECVLVKINQVQYSELSAGWMADKAIDPSTTSAISETSLFQGAQTISNRGKARNHQI